MSVSDLNGILGAVYDPANQALRVSAGGVGSGDAAIDDLTDVTTSAPAIGQTLVWNGTAWVNGPLDLADGDARTGTLPLGNGGTGATTASGARTALELGDAATKNVGTAAGTVAAGDDSRITGAATAANLTSHTSATGASVHGLGSASVKDAPASGDATSGQVVLGSDTRLTDARTPSAHKTSHATGGTDALTASDIGAQASNTLLTAVAGLSTTGLIARTGAGTASSRTITGGTGLTVTNGDGVSGNPTLALDQDLIDIAGISRARGGLIVGGASAYQALALGASGTSLMSDGTDAAWKAATRVLHSNAGTTVSNSSSRTSALTSAYTIPANTLAVGDALLVRASGVVTNNTGGNTTFTLKIGPDVANNGVFTTGNVAAAASSRIWALDVLIHVQAIGGVLVGAERYSGTFAISGTGGATTWDTLSAVGTHYSLNQVMAYATNTDIVFDLFVTLSTASASYSFRCDGFTLVHIPKVP